MKRASGVATEVESSAVTSISTTTILREVARRFGLKFGKVEITVHDGVPSVRVLVEHRILVDVEKL